MYLVLLRNGDKPLDNPSSYKPFCLLDCAGKLLEKVTEIRIKLFLDRNTELDDNQFSFLDTKSGLDDRQFSFHKGWSTTNAVDCHSKIVEANHLKFRIGMLTLDITNASNSAATLKSLNTFPRAFIDLLTATSEIGY